MVTDNKRMDNKQYWLRVKELLKKSNKTQVELSQSTGIILGTLKGWQVNNRLPGSEESVQIAQYLNTTVEYLVTGNQSSEKEKVDKLVKDIQDLLTAYNLGR